MAPETLGPGNYPDILEYPLDFIDKALKTTGDPKAQIELEKSILVKWPEIDSRILVAPLIWAPPIKKRLRYMEKTVKISDGVFLTEKDLNEEIFGSPIIELDCYKRPTESSPKNYGEYIASILFKIDSKKTRNLTNVSIKHASFFPSEGKPSFTGIQIQVYPTFSVL